MKFYISSALFGAIAVPLLFLLMNPDLVLKPKKGLYIETAVAGGSGDNSVPSLTLNLPDELLEDAEGANESVRELARQLLGVSAFDSLVVRE